MNKLDNTIHEEIMIGYRSLIEDRYQYEYLEKNYTLPKSFDRKKIDDFRNYFLTYVYPDPEKRRELDDAFKSLDSYTQNPEKILKLLMDSFSLIFKYGRHLPKTLKAGLKALGTYRAAVNFEKKLIQIAQDSDTQRPYTSEDVASFMLQLQRNEIEAFFIQNEKLFEVLFDRTLVQKIKEIVAHLIHKMKEKPNTYSPVEIRGMEIGRDIIVHGDQLFDQLSDKDQKIVLKFVIQVERDALKLN